MKKTTREPTVLHVITGLKKTAGTTTFVVELCHALSQLELVNPVIAVSDVDNEENWLPYHEIPLASIASIEKLHPAPDLIHIHGLWTPILHQVNRWALKHSIPVIFSPHGMLAPWAMKHKRWKKLLPWLMYQRRDLQNASAFHITAPIEEKWLNDLGLQRRCFVAPLGTYLPDLPEHREKPPNRRILFVGRIYPVKGLRNLIQAFAMLRKTGNLEGWSLLLVGPDQAGHVVELESVCEREGLHVTHGSDISEYSGEVHFSGALYGDEKNKAYLTSDLFVLPSFTENFGGVVIDALAYGVPVVASTNTPWEELERERCGKWVDNSPKSLAAALMALIALSDEERREMGENGRQLVFEKYTWASVAKQMADAYSEVRK